MAVVALVVMCGVCSVTCSISRMACLFHYFGPSSEALRVFLKGPRRSLIEQVCWDMDIGGELLNDLDSIW